MRTWATGELGYLESSGATQCEGQDAFRRMVQAMDETGRDATISFQLPEDDDEVYYFNVVWSVELD